MALSCEAGQPRGVLWPMPGHTRLTRMAPQLYLLCGLPTSGKTTRARELEAAANVVRLTADEWIARLYPDDAEAAARDERRDRVEALQWQIVERLLRIGRRCRIGLGAVDQRRTRPLPAAR